MIATTEQLGTYLESFTEFQKRAAGRELPWLRRMREGAFARFCEVGFPTTHDEDWRFTNVSAIAKTPFELAGDVRVSQDEVKQFGLPGPGCRLVFVNGRFARELSSQLGRLGWYCSAGPVGIVGAYELGCSRLAGAPGGRKMPKGNEVTAFRFLEEQGWVPALAVAGEVKFPTARDVLIGTGKPDYTFTLVASKRFGNFDTHFNFGYTIVGQPGPIHLDNIFDFAVAEEWHAIPATFDVVAEFLANTALVFSHELFNLAHDPIKFID